MPPKLGKGSTKRISGYAQAVAGAGTGPVNPTGAPPQSAGSLESDEQLMRARPSVSWDDQYAQGPSAEEVAAFDAQQQQQQPQQQMSQMPQMPPQQQGARVDEPLSRDRGSAEKVSDLASKHVSMKTWQVILLCLASAAAGVLLCVVIYKLIKNRAAV